ncbi:MAG: ABC transporter substrate-binding protein [Pseudanabaenaceae cyanobacterium bins.68]|nr:ABC transporter substrate-binding protein [Pseudanabaenaceae cyanobacterium bins.68]
MERWSKILLVLVICGCTPIAKTSNRISLGTTATIRTLDPADNTAFFASNILFNTTETLYTYAPGTTNLVPLLAQALPQVSGDGLTYRIQLRQGIKFHDQTNFDAIAMAFSLRRFMNAGGAPAYILKDAIAAVKANSATELEIKLKQPLQFFPKLLAYTGTGAISPKAYGQKFLPNQIIGTGAYRLQEYSPGKILRLEPFADYWAEPPRNSGIDIQFFSSSANLLNGFKTGSVDVAFQTLSPNQIRNLIENASSKGWQVTSGQSATILYMSLNLRQPPLNHPLVRQAIAAALDRRLLQQRVFQNQRLPIYSLIPQIFPAYRPSFQQKYGDGNSQLAQKLLQQAGYSPEHPAKLTIWYSPNYGGNGDLVASTLKAVLERNGGKALVVEIAKVNQTTANAFIDRGVYPIFLFDWVPDILDPDNFLDPFLTCAKGDEKGCTAGSSHFQGSFYFNPKINQLIAAQRREPNSWQREQLLTRIQQIVAEDVPFIPLWQNQEYVFSSPKITGARLEPNQQLNYRLLRKRN